MRDWGTQYKICCTNQAPDLQTAVALQLLNEPRSFVSLTLSKQEAVSGLTLPHH